MKLALQLQPLSDAGAFSGRLCNLPPPAAAATGAGLSSLEHEQIAQQFQQHGPAVYRRALRLLGNGADAEEATQEIFLRAFRGAEAFARRSQATTWLYQITTNYCLNLLRDRARRAELERERLPAPEDAAPAHSDDAALVRRLLAFADPRQAQAAVYVFIDGATHEEAAELLGVSKRTVGNLVERFREWAQQMTDEPEPRARAAGGSR